MNTLPTETAPDTQRARKCRPLPNKSELKCYRIEKTLHQDDLSIRYLAEDTTRHAKVVIVENMPVFCAARSADNLNVVETEPEYQAHLARFVERANQLMELRLPGIQNVVAGCKAQGTAYYMSPVIEGDTLLEIAPKPELLDEAWLLPHLRSLLLTLDNLQKHSIYHGNINPSSIRVTPGHVTVLTDFGVPQICLGAHLVLGETTPGYAPPEQLMPAGICGIWTDIYSLGATCYRLITGERPPTAEERLADYADTLRPLATRDELKKRFSHNLLAGIDRALNLHVMARWLSPRAWFGSLPGAPQPKDMAAAAMAPVPAPSSPQQERSRSRKWLLLAALLLLPLLGGLSLCSEGLGGSEDFNSPSARQKAEAALKAKGVDTSDYYARIRDEVHERSKDPEILRNLLIASGISGNEHMGWGSSDHTLIGWLGIFGHADCIPILLNHPDTDINEVTSCRGSALGGTAAAGQVEALRALLAAKNVDVNIQDDQGATPLYYAAYHGHAECVKVLLEVPGIRPDLADNWNASPLYVAVRNRYSKCVQLLAEMRGIDPNRKARERHSNEVEKTALYEASNDFKIMKCLLAIPGIDVNLASDTTGVDFKQLTPLMVADDNGTRLLLAAPGIQVNQKDKAGRTALHHAAKAGEITKIRLLLEHGADPHLKDKAGRLPVDVARYTDCEKVLRDAMDKP